MINPLDTANTGATNTAVTADMGQAAADPATDINLDLPAAKANEFTLPPSAFDPDSTPAQMAEVAAYVGGWFETAQMPKQIGSYLAEEMANIAPKFQAMNEVQRELHKREQMASLQRVWGDQTDQKIAMAKQLLDEIEARQPGLAELLDETGAANSATVVMQFALHAERLAARRGG